MTAARQLRLGHLYPSLMNIYGDRGNIICLTRRCRLRGIELHAEDQPGFWETRGYSNSAEPGFNDRYSS